MPEFDRCSGILLHITSLPSPYGIGTMGAAAHGFAEFLSAAGQSIWQMLPLGPTGFGNSPYQSFSSFAGNPYLIDLDELNRFGLDLSEYDWGQPGCVDYGKQYENRHAVLRKLYELSPAPADMGAFMEKNSHWLPDYALFTALKKHFSGMPWYMWPMDIRSRKPKAVEKYTELLKDDIDFECWVQYQFRRQFDALAAHCRRLGIKMMGDLPIYVAPDSADVWADPHEFLLDDDFIPTEVAGVPPDYFSETGQLWGNPLYNWDKMKENGYAFWKNRLQAAADIYDIIRLDHFRGFESYWSVPKGSENAIGGKWNPGPGEDFIDMLHEQLPHTLFVAEDLGIITDKVTQLREYAKMPGMAILSFAFQPDEESSYLPHNIEKDCVCYSGTHDNAPLRALKDELSDRQMQMIDDYCGSFEGIIRSGMVCPANVFIAQLQDWLDLGSESRMNTPGKSEDCWTWRLTKLPDIEMAEKISRMTQTAFRCSKKEEHPI